MIKPNNEVRDETFKPFSFSSDIMHSSTLFFLKMNNAIKGT